MLSMAVANVLVMLAQARPDCRDLVRLPLGLDALTGMGWCFGLHG